MQNKSLKKKDLYGEWHKALLKDTEKAFKYIEEYIMFPIKWLCFIWRSNLTFAHSLQQDSNGHSGTCMRPQKAYLSHYVGNLSRRSTCCQSEI